MKKIIIILFILVSIGAYIIFKPQTQQSGQAFPDSDADIILFSSQTCPHCQKVEAYIAENNLNSRLKIAKNLPYQPIITSSAPSSTEAPFSTFISNTFPSRSLEIVFSIFIASSTNNFEPILT